MNSINPARRIRSIATPLAIHEPVDGRRRFGWDLLLSAGTGLIWLWIVGRLLAFENAGRFDGAALAAMLVAGFLCLAILAAASIVPAPATAPIPLAVQYARTGIYPAAIVRTIPEPLETGYLPRRPGRMEWQWQPQQTFRRPPRILLSPRTSPAPCSAAPPARGSGLLLLPLLLPCGGRRMDR